MTRYAADLDPALGAAANEMFGEIEIPPLLQASVDRHRDNLAQLVRTLRSAGFGDGQIDSGVSALVASYRAELKVAIRALRQAAA